MKNKIANIPAQQNRYQEAFDALSSIPLGEKLRIVNLDPDRVKIVRTMLSKFSKDKMVIKTTYDPFSKVLSLWVLERNET